MVSMNYGEAIERLYALEPELAPSANGSGPRRKFDLASMRRLCAELGAPQHRVPAVLIAGTNGKGSTAATLASILTAAGYCAGLYTSPHLTRVNERIQLARTMLPPGLGAEEVRGGDGPLTLTPIADDDFARVYTLVDEAAMRLVAAGELPHPPSFFERLTAVAFGFYAGIDRPGAGPRAEIVVLEVGLGGRLDATNVVEPLVSVITDIALDHQDYLGDTITEIAGEKCGILRREGILVTLSQHPEANQAIGEAAARLNVRGVNAAVFLPPARRNSAEPEARGAWRNRYPLCIDEIGLIEVDSPLAGDHQQRNLALALAAANELRNTFGYKIGVDAMERGVRRTSWPGRLEWLTPRLLLDVAHNPAGAWALRSAIAGLPAAQPRTLLFSCLRDKDVREMARILFPLFDSSADGDPARRRDHIVLAPIPSPRAAAVDELSAVAAELGVAADASADVPGALRLAQRLTPPGGFIVASGSVYLVGAVREAALGVTTALATEAAEVPV
jgi:dihydrofolate synthase/folylpolyglutamate synthase